MANTINCSLRGNLFTADMDDSWNCDDVRNALGMI